MGVGWHWCILRPLPLSCSAVHSRTPPHPALQEFLLLDYSVLLSDVDILTLKNPFEHLYRDEDVEALSDGFDPQTAYGRCQEGCLWWWVRQEGCCC